MSIPRTLTEALKRIPVRNLPLGKPGFRYESASRLSVGLTKPKEIRHILRENQTRYEERVTTRVNRNLILTESIKETHASRFPSRKTVKKITHWKQEWKKRFINPGTVTIEASDVEKIKPDTLPVLARSVKEMRSAGVEWETIAVSTFKRYTSHIRDPQERFIKKSMVKKELLDAWKAENLKLEPPTRDSQSQPNNL